jgi:uncharacterized UBP type Zn finger protein
VLARYELRSLIMHHGNSPDSGHYTALVRHNHDNTGNNICGETRCWLHMDDHKVPAVLSEKQAMDCDHLVYILLYCLRE